VVRPLAGRNPVFLRELRQTRSLIAAWLRYARNFRFETVY
jgi:hypothetical protein